MMSTSAHFVCLIVLALSTVPSYAASDAAITHSKVTPLQKVIEMLNGMVAKGKEMKHQEEVEFAEFHEWCDQTRSEKEKNIKEAIALIEQLEADIAKAEADAEELAGEITELEAQIAADEKEAANATEIRDKEHADYAASHLDFSESIDAIARALQVLSTRTGDIPQSLLQLQNSNTIPLRAKEIVESFLAMQSEATADAGAPEANAYEFQSGSVIAMLEKLSAKFKAQLLDLEKAEISARSNYQMLMQQLTDDIKANKDSVAQKTAAKAERLEDAASAKGDLEVTKKGKAEDEATLSDTNAECSRRSDEYEKNQVIRSEEIKVLEEATKILQSEAVTGNAEEYLPAAALLQAKATSLSQLRVQPNGELAKRQRVASYLQARAKDLNSKYLSLAAAHALEDPFGKVKKMIKDLIVKLMEEANEEADAKAYCDTELATNKQTREIKQQEVDELTSKIEELTALSTQLATEIKELSDAIAEIRAQQAEATKIRGEEKATNAETIADAKEAQLAVEKATELIKDFYAKADAALLQGEGGMQIKQEMAEASKEPYKGMQVGGGNILSFLDVVLSDFARLEAETQAAEDAAVEAYEKFMAESNQDIAVKETTMEHNENKKSQTDDEIRSLKKELELTQTELDKALNYYDKLKAECLDKGLSYSERVKAREEEIASLQEALKVLDQQELA